MNQSKQKQNLGANPGLNAHADQVSHDHNSPLERYEFTDMVSDHVNNYPNTLSALNIVLLIALKSVPAMLKSVILKAPIIGAMVFLTIDLGSRLGQTAFDPDQPIWKRVLSASLIVLSTGLAIAGIAASLTTAATVAATLSIVSAAIYAGIEIGKMGYHGVKMIRSLLKKEPDAASHRNFFIHHTITSLLAVGFVAATVFTVVPVAPGSQLIAAACLAAIAGLATAYNGLRYGISEYRRIRSLQKTKLSKQAFSINSNHEGATTDKVAFSPVPYIHSEQNQYAFTPTEHKTKEEGDEAHISHALEAHPPHAHPDHSHDFMSHLDHSLLHESQHDLLHEHTFTHAHSEGHFAEHNLELQDEIEKQESGEIESSEHEMHPGHTSHEANELEAGHNHAHTHEEEHEIEAEDDEIEEDEEAKELEAEAAHEASSETEPEHNQHKKTDRHVENNHTAEGSRPNLKPKQSPKQIKDIESVLSEDLGPGEIPRE